MGYPGALVLDASEEKVLKTKRSILGIEQFIKQLQKGVKLNGIVMEKILRKVWLLIKLGCQMIFFVCD